VQCARELTGYKLLVDTSLNGTCETGLVSYISPELKSYVACIWLLALSLFMRKVLLMF